MLINYKYHIIYFASIIRIFDVNLIKYLVNLQNYMISYIAAYFKLMAQNMYSWNLYYSILHVIRCTYVKFATMLWFCFEPRIQRNIHYKIHFISWKTLLFRAIWNSLKILRIEWTFNMCRSASLFICYLYFILKTYGYLL